MTIGIKGTNQHNDMFKKTNIVHSNCNPTPQGVEIDNPRAVYSTGLRCAFVSIVVQFGCKGPFV